jgi:hypothetical protein
MRPWPLVALAACVPPPPIVQPAIVDGVTCHLAQPYDGKMTFPGVTDRTQLDCTATNRSGQTSEVCAQPYVGVRETGALYTSHGPACSTELLPGASELFAVRLDMNRLLCRLDHGGCIVQTIAVKDDVPDAERVVELARALEDRATWPGRDRPTVRECDSLVDAWTIDPAFGRYASFLAHPNELRAFCIGLSRATFDCLRAARNSAQAEACAPV